MYALLFKSLVNSRWSRNVD